MFAKHDREMLVACTNRGGTLPFLTVYENDALKDQIKLYEKFMALMFNSDSTKTNDILIHNGELYRLDTCTIKEGDSEVKTLTGEFTYVGVDLANRSDMTGGKTDGK